MVTAAPPPHPPSLIPKPHIPSVMNNPTSLIARAEALDAFMNMQPAANQARQPSQPPPTGCLCFPLYKRPHTSIAPRPRREYYPDNLSVQPQRHKWTEHMEWLIIACVDFLERFGLDERNLFAVSAVDHLVRDMTVDIGSILPNATDPHVAAGVIKAQIRHADQPLIDKDCLRIYIESTSEQPHLTTSDTYRDSHLCKTLDAMQRLASPRRAYILARMMRLLGRVSANVQVSRMNAHCLAKCVAPSMLHWDPNSSFALLMLGKITAFVMYMIEDARVFDENLCQKIQTLHSITTSNPGT